MGLGYGFGITLSTISVVLIFCPWMKKTSLMTHESESWGTTFKRAGSRLQNASSPPWLSMLCRSLGDPSIWWETVGILHVALQWSHEQAHPQSDRCTYWWHRNNWNCPLIFNFDFLLHLTRAYFKVDVCTFTLWTCLG